MPPRQQDDDDFSRYKHLILHELQQLRVEVKSLNGSMQKYALDLTAQRVKASLTGALAGSVPIAIFMLWEYFINKG